MSVLSATRSAPIVQVTDEMRLVSNIYCERPFCAADSSRFLFARQLNDGGCHDPTDWEYVLCEFDSWRTTPVSRGRLGVSISYDNCFYHQRESDQGEREIIGIDLATGAVSLIHQDRSQGGQSPFNQHSHPHAYLTPDLKWMVFNSDRTGRPQIYAAKISPDMLPD